MRHEDAAQSGDFIAAKQSGSGCEAIWQKMGQRSFGSKSLSFPALAFLSVSPVCTRAGVQGRRPSFPMQLIKRMPFSVKDTFKNSLAFELFRVRFEIGSPAS